jgi:anti-sigma regulatory factor (Ser/Thr protein kinase)
MNYKVKIKGNEQNLEKTWDLVHFLAVQHGMQKEDADVFAVAVGEAYGNGLHYSPDNKAKLTLTFYDDKIVAYIVNKGEKISFQDIKIFDTQQDFMQYKDGKLGIPMIKKLVDDVRYKHFNGKNKLILSKRIEHESKRRRT